MKTINVNALTERYQQLKREQAIQQAIGEGIMTDKEIGKRFDIPRSTITHRRRAMALTPPKKPRRQYPLRRKGWTPQLQQLTLQALLEGHTLKEVQEVSGIDINQLRWMMRDLGLTNLTQHKESKPLPERSRRIGAQRRREPAS